MPPIRTRAYNAPRRSACVTFPRSQSTPSPAAEPWAESEELCDQFTPMALPLPSLGDVLSTSSPAAPDSPLSQCLSTLFEHSEILDNKIIPVLSSKLETRPAPPENYSTLVDLAIDATHSLPPEEQAAFIGGHPRIGEASNLSALSAAEQASKATPEWVLKRLAHLNSCYERRFPGLVYITFVNGRSRELIMREMEGALRVTAVPDNATPDVLVEPSADTFSPVEVGGKLWMEELRRAVEDVGRIAKARLRGMGLE